MTYPTFLLIFRYNKIVKNKHMFRKIISIIWIIFNALTWIALFILIMYGWRVYKIQPDNFNMLMLILPTVIMTSNKCDK